MKFKTNAYYIATSDSSNGEIKSGDTIHVKRSLDKTGYFFEAGEYYHTIFLPPKKDGRTFFGMEPMNRCEYIKTVEEVEMFLEGTNMVYNLKIVNEIIADHQKKIDKIKKLHEIQ
ncbi:MAG: hypothetical protein AABY15_02790 [Nanoarchaeota archaeon]